MRDHETRIDLSAFDALEQRRKVAMSVALSGSDGERSIDDHAHRESVYEAAVDTTHRNDTAVSAFTNGLPQSEWAIGFDHQGLLGAVDGVHRTVGMRFEPN